MSILQVLSDATNPNNEEEVVDIPEINIIEYDDSVSETYNKFENKYPDNLTTPG